jgi:long-subunit acyl-CoA synthetase (AMP-forming)
MSPLHDILRDRRGPLLVDAAGTHDAAAFFDHVQRLAGQLSVAGVRCVASRLDNGRDWVALDLALRQLGLVHVPAPIFFSPAQVSHLLASSGADAWIGQQAPGDAWTSIGPGLWINPAGRDTPQVLPHGTACITYTSGTTGQPKGVCLAESSLIAVARSLVDAMQSLDVRRHLCLLPMATLLENVAGIYAPLISGAEIAVPSLAEIGYSGASGIDVPRLLHCLHRYQPESIILVPQLLLAIVAAAENGIAPPPSLKFVAVGGARVGESLLRRAAAIGLPVFEGYGLSECASVVTLNRPGFSKPGSAGRVLPHASVRISDDGEIHVSGSTYLGYVGEAPPAPGDYATGDLGEIDADGFLNILGRRRNVFITSYGRNVNPEWVEAELVQHPLIAQAVVYGEARPSNAAVIVPRRADVSQAAIAAALLEVNAGLPDYARVAQFVFATAPFDMANGQLTANGRPRRDAVWQIYGDAVSRLYDSSAEHQP